jgi:hypothetical protein
MSAFPMAIKYRMGGLFPGAVTRTHPVSILPYKVDPTVPPGTANVGDAVKLNAAGDAVMPVGAGDTAATSIFGVIVRAYPMQVSVVNADGSTVLTYPVVDVLREGYIGVKTTGAPVIGTPAYVVLADGTFAAAAAAGIAGPMVNAHFNGPPDANGYAELFVQPFQG